MLQTWWSFFGLLGCSVVHCPAVENPGEITQVIWMWSSQVPYTETETIKKSYHWIACYHRILFRYFTILQWFETKQ